MNLEKACISFVNTFSLLCLGAWEQENVISVGLKIMLTVLSTNQYEYVLAVLRKDAYRHFQHV